MPMVTYDYPPGMCVERNLNNYRSPTTTSTNTQHHHNRWILHPITSSVSGDISCQISWAFLKCVLYKNRNSKSNHCAEHRYVLQASAGAVMIKLWSKSTGGSLEMLIWLSFWIASYYYCVGILWFFGVGGMRGFSCLYWIYLNTNARFVTCSMSWCVSCKWSTIVCLLTDAEKIEN